MTQELERFPKVFQPTPPKKTEVAPPAIQIPEFSPILAYTQLTGCKPWQQEAFFNIPKQFEPGVCEEHNPLSLIKPDSNWLNLMEYLMKDMKWQQIKHDLILINAWTIIDDIVDSHFRAQGWRLSCPAAMPLILTYLINQPPELVADFPRLIKEVAESVIHALESLPKDIREKEYLVKLPDKKTGSAAKKPLNFLSYLMPQELL